MSKIEYHLTALENFTCIGSDCPANCCRANWKIELDPEIYQQWQALVDAKERDRLLAAVVKHAENDKETLYMKLNSVGSCQLQTDDRLCSLQQKHGASMLPTVCQNYPRVTDATNIYSFSSLFLSCPEVAKSVLFEDSGPVFQKSTPRQINLLTGDDQVKHALSELVDSTMAESKSTLATRAFYLADVIVKISRLSIQKRLNATSFNQIIANSKNDLHQIGVGLKTGRLRPPPIISGSFWHSIARIGQGTKLLPELEASSPFLADLSSEPVVRTQQCEVIHSEIQRLRNTSESSWKTYEAHFIRYLYASLMCNGFPWNPESNNYIVALMLAMVPFALTRLRLWLLAEKKGNLEDEDVVEITYQVERAISHNNLVLKILNRTPDLLELDQYHKAFVLL